jgi:hypothetical protein
MSGKTEILERFFKPKATEKIRLIPSLVDMSGSMQSPQVARFQATRRVHTNDYIYDYVMNDVAGVMNMIHENTIRLQIERRLVIEKKEDENIYLDLIRGYADENYERKKSMAIDSWKSNSKIILSFDSDCSYKVRFGDVCLD